MRAYVCLCGGGDGVVGRGVGVGVRGCSGEQIRGRDVKFLQTSSSGRREISAANHTIAARDQCAAAVER